MEKDLTPAAVAAPAKGDVRRTAEEWRDEQANQGAKHPGGWDAAGVYAMAKALSGWPTGKLLTEAEYDAAVKAALNVSVR